MNPPTTDTAGLSATQLLIRIRAFQHRRWKQGNPISIEKILETHPILKTDQESLLELIYGEYCVREVLGEHPVLETYQQRFPELSDRLGRLLEIHHALDSGGPSFASITGTVEFSHDNSVVISPDKTTRMLSSVVEKEGHPDQPLLGRFGDYHLIEEIARGGMGIVYRAKQLQAQRIVALKMILAGKFASSKDLKRFYSEAAAAAKLDHPNIVPIYEVGEHDDHPFFTMAYVEGQNLAERICQGPLAQRQAVSFARELAGAIEYAHQRGIVHRDLKPANILLTEEGQTRITDFGLAKQIGAQSELTVTGDVVGTPNYMSPEQVRSDHSEVGPASDIYSLGAILYCLLTGRPPFQAATILETFTQLVETEPVPPRQLVPSISHDLETVCLKCLHKDPAKRYGSATELVADLDRYLAGKPVQARRVTNLERAWRWCRRKPLIAALTGTVTLLFLLIAIGSSLAAVGLSNLAQQEKRARQQAEIAQRNAEQQQQQYLDAKQVADNKTAIAMTSLQVARHEKRTADHNLYAAHMNLAQMAWQDSQVENVLDLLHRESRSVSQHDIRNFEWHYLRRLCHQDQETIKPGFMPTGVVYGTSSQHVILGSQDGRLVYWNLAAQEPLHEVRLHRGRIHEIAASDDGQQLATAGDDGTVVIWGLDQRQEQQRIHVSEHPTCSVRFNRDGTQLATGSADGTVRVWNLSSGQCIQTLSGHRHDTLSVCFNSDGTLLATGSMDATACIWDTSSGALLHRRQHRGSVDAVEFSRHGNTLVTAGGDGIIRIWPHVEEDVTTVIEAGQSAIRHIRLSQDGDQLLSAGASGSIKLWNVPKAKLMQTFQGHLRPVRWLAWGSDEREFVSASWDMTLKRWDMSPPPETLQAHQHIVRDIAYSPDEQWLATVSADQTLKLWKASSRQLNQVFKATGDSYRTVKFSPDGQWLAAGSQQGILTLWNMSNRNLLMQQPFQHGAINQLAFSPDSHQVAVAANDGSITIWDLTHHQQQSCLRGHQQGVQSVSFSPCGTRLVSGGHDKTLRLWNILTGACIQEISGHASKILAVSWSPNGKWIASGGHDRSIRIWDVKRQQVSHELKGHTGPVTQLAFSPDSQRIASSSYDHTVKIWDSGFGNQLLTLRGHRGVTWSVQFSPSGRWLVSGSSDSTIRFWDGRPMPQNARSSREPME